MGRNIRDAVRDLCLAFPQAQERAGHGMPDYKVGGKTFAMLAVNHHGDGRIALWVHAPPGVQQLHTQGEPRFYFVPPYVGRRGWLGVMTKGKPKCIFTAKAVAPHPWANRFWAMQMSSRSAPPPLQSAGMGIAV